MSVAFTPDSWGVGPSQTDQSYVDFMDDVEKYLQQMSDEIQRGVDWVWEQWDSSILLKYGKWVGLATYLLIRHARNNLEDAIEAIWDKFTEVCEAVWVEVKRLFATPWGLMDLSERYSEVAGLLRGEATLIDRIKRHIDKGWSGDAFVSYAGIADEQKNALNGLAGGLSTASTAAATGAHQIWDIWIAVMDYLLNSANIIFGKVKDATDAGQWVTLAAGVVTSLIGQLVVEIGKLVTKLLSFWADNQTVNMAVWNGLNDGKDLAGLIVTGAGDQRKLNWPEPSPSDTGDMGDKDDWAHDA